MRSDCIFPVEPTIKPSIDWGGSAHENKSCLFAAPIGLLYETVIEGKYLAGSE